MKMSWRFLKNDMVNSYRICPKTLKSAREKPGDLPLLQQPTHRDLSDLLLGELMDLQAVVTAMGEQVTSRTNSRLDFPFGKREGGG
jgi:hypothetical protein